MNKKSVLLALGIGLLSLGFIGVNRIYAEENNDPRASIIQKIASKFNLNEAEVRAVFDEERENKKAEMKQLFVSRLDQLVKDGKITTAQKDLIIKKHDEIESSRESWKSNFDGMTKDERQAAMQKHHAEMEQWAKSNGIDMSMVFQMGGQGKRGHRFDR